MKKIIEFIEKTKEGLNVFFNTTLKSDVNYTGGRFIVTFYLINHGDLITDGMKIEVCTVEFIVKDTGDLVSGMIEIPFLGYPETPEDEMSLDKTKEYLTYTLETEKSKIIFENLKK